MLRFEGWRGVLAFMPDPTTISPPTLRCLLVLAFRFVIAPAEPPGQVQGGAVPVPPRRGSAPAPPTPGDKVAAGTERLRQLGVEVHEK